MKKFLVLPALTLAVVAPLAYTPSALAQVSIGISVNFAPPALPVYEQPPIPGPDYLWSPGYWAWDDYAQDYYWVPGTWVLAPRPGLLWTPPWWGWEGGIYRFHTGYWGPHVGFYGGVPYGFGYTGVGFQGARWDGPHVSYNRSVTNVTNNVNVTNVYNTTVVNRITNVSYNGGPGGVEARPSAEQEAAMHEEHAAPTAAQERHFQAARQDRQMFAGANHGRPPLAAAAHPGEFGGPGAVPTREAPTYHGPQPGEAGPRGAPPGPAGAPPEAGGPGAHAEEHGGVDTRSLMDRPTPAPTPMERSGARPEVPERGFHPEVGGRAPEAPAPRPEANPEFNRLPAESERMHPMQAPAPRPQPMPHVQPMPRPQPAPRMAPPPRPRPMGGGGGGHPGPQEPHR